MTLEVRRVATDQERSAAYVVRHDVFVGEQGVAEDIERDALDDTADHIVALLDDKPVGAGRLVVRGRTAVIGRMAVHSDARGTGVGAALLRELEQIARERGCTDVELHAQVSARGFYDRLGYAAHGETYHEAGIEHIHMHKPL